MPFAWRDFLEVARGLIDSSPPPLEATMRTAVGRAYYAAFGEARTYAVANFGYTPVGNDREHRELSESFKVRGKFSWAASTLGQLRLSRNQCDYDNEAGDVAAMARASLARAEKLISQLRPPASPR